MSSGTPGAPARGAPTRDGERQGLPISETSWRAIPLVLATVNLVTAAWAVLDHASFAENLAPFGAPNGDLVPRAEAGVAG